MGLLFVFENDDAAKGPNVDVSMESYHAVVVAARASRGAFPLVRRLSDYYRDTTFDVDELEPLVSELRVLRPADPATVGALIELALNAVSANLGLLVISD